MFIKIEPEEGVKGLPSISILKKTTFVLEIFGFSFDFMESVFWVQLYTVVIITKSLQNFRSSGRWFQEMTHITFVFFPLPYTI